jgi:hypothetical protein
MAKDKTSDASTSALDDSYICRVDFYNQLKDGTVLVGIRADFLYSDGSDAPAINPNANIGDGGGASLYSQNKCVKRIDVIMTADRPSGQQEVYTASSGNAPQGECLVHQGFSLTQASTIKEKHALTLKDRPIVVLRNPTQVGNG